MHSFKKSKGIWFHFRPFLVVILITNLTVMGFPAKASKEIVKRDGSQVVKLLRELPPLEDCNPYLERIDNLKRMKENPVAAEARQKLSYIIQQAEQGKLDAIENAKKAAMKNMQAVVTDLAVNKMKELHNFKSLVERQKELLIAKQGLLSTNQWLSMSTKLNKLLQDTNDLIGNIGKIEKSLNYIERRVDRHQEVQQQINETKRRCASMQETLASLNRDFAESGVALEIAKGLASGLGPMGPVLVQLINLSIEVGFIALEGLDITRDLPRYRENLQIMLNQHLKLDLEIEIANRKLRECLKRAQDRQKLIDEEKALQAKKTPPPPVKTPPPPVEKTPPAGVKKGGGGGIILGMLGIGVAAAAVYYGAQYLGGAKLCCKTAEDWHWCPTYELCCPKGFSWYSPSTNKCYTLYDVTFGSGPNDAVNCRPGGWCK